MSEPKEVVRKYRLGQMMVRDGVITEEQLQQALDAQKESGKMLGRVLRDLMIVPEEIFIDYLSQQLGIPKISLADIDEIPPDIINVLPDFLVRRHIIIPISKTADSITVAMSDPLDIFALDDVSLTLGHYRVNPVIAPETEIWAAIEKHYGKSVTGLESILQGAKGQRVELVQEEAQIDMTKISRDAEEAPIVKLVNHILLEAIISNTSDIHLEPYEKKFRVRYRIDGVLHEVLSPPKDLQMPITARIKIISHMDIAEHRLPQDGRCKVILEGRSVDLRVSSTPTVFGEKVVIRILDPQRLCLDLNKLGFDPAMAGIYQEYIKAPYGIILVTGPTGSGKTTTLYSTLTAINTEDKNIMTVEDPVEYILIGINQQQVKPEIGLDFVTGLRSFLRQDPDVIMLGEIRDKETAEVAINAALTGHLVFSTLHTNDATGAVTRLLNMGIPPFLIVSSVVMSLAQRLIRVLCLKCKEPYEIGPEPLREIGIEAEGSKEITLYRPSGCKHCTNTGYRGRIGVYEIMVMSEKIRELVLERKPAGIIKAAACEEGMVSLQTCAAQKVLSGITSVEEYLRVT